MILTIFRPKRTKDGKPHVSRSYRGRYRLEEGDKLTDIPLRTTDKRVARERLEQIVREKQLEALGVLSPHRTALQTSLEKHLSDYLADLDTDAGLLAVWDKVANLPSFTDPKDSQIDSQNSQIDSQNLVRLSPSLSFPVKEVAKLRNMQATHIQQSTSDMSGPVTTSQENVEWSGRQDLNLRPRGPKPRALPS